MTTTDPDALTERIARAIHDGPSAQAQYVEAHIPPHLYDDCRWKRQYREDATAVLPIVAVEVRKAKAEALREAGRDLERGWPNRLGIDLPPEDYDHAGDHAIDTAHEYLKRRADRIETGDQL